MINDHKMVRTTFLLIMLTSSAWCLTLPQSVPAVSTTESLVISTSTVSSSEKSESSAPSQKEASSSLPNNNDEAIPTVPKIYEMRIDTNITNRFAKTLVSSKVKNLGSKAQEARFSVVLPETAYITGFVMEIGGKTYEAYLKEKQEAKQIYQGAVDAGLSAGHVEANARDSNRFSVNLNIEPQSKAVFKLTYEELLKRHNDQYELVINIHPGQPVKNLDVEIHINETRPLKFVKTAPLRSGNEISKNNENSETSAQITNIDPSSALVKFSPNIEKQKQFATALGTKEEHGLSGQFVVQYDVERDPQGGEVLVKDGYFVHFFAPSDLKPLPKQIVFVLDTSGSMMGIRIKQLKEAMKSILSELKPEDFFNIIDFDSSVRAWNVNNQSVAYKNFQDDYPSYLYSDVSTTTTETPPEAKIENAPDAYQASEKNIEDGIKVVDKLEAYGGTDILPALETGIKLVNQFQKTHKKSHQPLIVFLTDGEATSGETDPDKISSGVARTNERKIPIFSLSLGDDADRSLLQKISLQNHGFSRRIYEAADASLQLHEFYKDISSPLLNDVSFKYVSGVANTTKTNFPLIFKGSELVVVGECLNEGSDFAPPQIEANGVAGSLHFAPVKVERPVGSLERLWAYLTVKQILEARDAADNKKPFEEKALKLALKYSFVTPVSSLVVVKPNNTEDSAKTEDASKSDPALGWNSRSGYAAPPGGQYYGPPVSTLSLSSSISNKRLFSVPAYSFAPGLNVPLMEPMPISDVVFDTDSYDGASQVDAAPESASTPFKLESTSNIPEVSSELPSIVNQLPWIKDILRDGNIIELSSGNFTLGVNETRLVNPECNAINGTVTGQCTYLEKCPFVFGTLTDVKTYEEYFCALDEYAGVCCPTNLIPKGTSPSPP